MRRRAAKGLSLLANYTWSVVCRTPRASFADVCVIYPAEQQRPGGREGPALGLFGAFGPLLSITGTFGLASYTVSKRLRELSIRVALGAQAQQILSAALGRMLILLASGSVVGLVLGVTASRLLSAIVYQATTQDPFVLTALAFTLLLTGSLSVAGPVRRALHVDPASVLREQ